MHLKLAGTKTKTVCCRDVKVAASGVYFNFNFNSVQLALVLEDYEPPALRVQGFVSRKKGARSIVEEKKEGEKKIIIMIIKKVK